MIIPASISNYREWRAAKLDCYPKSVAEMLVKIAGLSSLGTREKAEILASCERANMAVYSCRDTAADRNAIRNFASEFGLTRIDRHLCAHEDGVAEVTAASNGERGAYVPYSNRSLSWHTDGYYYEEARRLQGVVLHCVRHAIKGGRTEVLDPQIAYLRLRDANPDYINAFEHPDCMHIPANEGSDGEIRAAVTGPVFWRDSASGALRMRYSERKKNIRWRDDAVTTAARACLAELLGDEEGLVLRFYLQPGQGLISNNVLHNRTAYEDTATQTRLLYRARFFDGISNGEKEACKP